MTSPNAAMSTYDELSTSARKLVRDLARTAMVRMPSLTFAEALELVFKAIAWKLEHEPRVKR